MVARRRAGREAIAAGGREQAALLSDEVDVVVVAIVVVILPVMAEASDHGVIRPAVGASAQMASLFSSPLFTQRYNAESNRLQSQCEEVIDQAAFAAALADSS